MTNERLIFVTNDDSYLSKGFRHAVELASRFGRVVAIAPDKVQSGMSQAITINSPLFLRRIEQREGVEIYSFSGTPVDCAKIAFDHFFANSKVDLVISGINHGSNAAVTVMYSGTMGAAIEGSFYGVPSIGLSVDDHSADADFEGAVRRDYSRGTRGWRQPTPPLVPQCQRTPLCRLGVAGRAPLPTDTRFLA